MLGEVAYCDLGISDVLIDVEDVVEVADADEVLGEHTVVDVAELLGQQIPPARRRALRLAGCVTPTWLLVGHEVRFVDSADFSGHELPSFVAPYLHTLCIASLATRGERLAYRLHSDALRARFG